MISICSVDYSNIWTFPKDNLALRMLIQPHSSFMPLSRRCIHNWKKALVNFCRLISLVTSIDVSYWTPRGFRYCSFLVNETKSVSHVCSNDTPRCNSFRSRLQTLTSSRVLFELYITTQIVPDKSASMSTLGSIGTRPMPDVLVVKNGMSLRNRH